MRLNFSKIKIHTILISLFYVFGLIGVYYSLKIPFAILVSSIIIFLIFRFQLSLKRSLILFLVFILGILRAQNSLNLDTALKHITSNNALLFGQIVSNKDISYKNNKVKFYINVKEADFLDGAKDNRDFKDLNSKVLISANLDGSIENNIKTGDYIQIKGKFVSPNPATNPYQFNYKKYLSNNDCFNILYADSKSFKIVKSPKFSLKNPNDSWLFILKNFEAKRNEILEKHSKNIVSPKLEVLGGIVFGNETINPDEKIKENFKNSGLLHLLAASGLNVALIYGIWWQIAGMIKLPFNFSIIVGAVFVILYTFMTGFPPSILRAGIMILFVLFGKLIDRNVSSVALIFFAGFLMLLFSPKMFFDIGFQLSFMVTLGLIVCCPVVLSKFEKADNEFREKYKNKNKILRYFIYIFTPSNLVSMVLVPLVAQLWVIPLQMHYFNNLAPMSIFANIAVVPFIGALSFIGFISSIVAIIPYLSDSLVFIFDLIANPLLGLLIKISECFASLKISLITTMGMNLFQILCFWVILLILALNIQNNFKRRKENIYLVVAILVLILSFSKITCFAKNAQIDVFDVNNESCILIKSPNKNFIMYDIPTSNIGFNKTETILNKYLQNERIKKLKYLILSHNLSDENKNLKLITPTLKIENIMTLKTAKNNETILSEKGFKVITYTLDDSIYTFLDNKKQTMLLMNKYKTNEFRKIEKYLPDKINVLKLPDKNEINYIDSYIVDRLKPDYVLISNGRGKQEKINPRVINLLYEKDIKILQTKDYGFIKIIFDKNGLKFYNFNKNTLKLQKIKFYNKVDFAKSPYIKNFLEKNL